MTWYLCQKGGRLYLVYARDRLDAQRQPEGILSGVEACWRTLHPSFLEEPYTDLTAAQDLLDKLGGESRG